MYFLLNTKIINIPEKTLYVLDYKFDISNL